MSHPPGPGQHLSSVSSGSGSQTPSADSAQQQISSISSGSGSTQNSSAGSGSGSTQQTPAGSAAGPVAGPSDTGSSQQTQPPAPTGSQTKSAGSTRPPALGSPRLPVFGQAPPLSSSVLASNIFPSFAPGTVIGDAWRRQFGLTTTTGTSFPAAATPTNAPWAGGQPAAPPAATGTAFPAPAPAPAAPIGPAPAPGPPAPTGPAVPKGMFRVGLQNHAPPPVSNAAALVSNAWAQNTPAAPATGFQTAAHDAKGTGAQFTNAPPTGDSGDPVRDALATVPLNNKFSLLEDDLGIQELIEKHTADVDPDEKLDDMAEYKVCAIANLPEKLKNSEPPYLYPDYLACDEEYKFPLGDVYDYRGTDIHPMFKLGKKKLNDKRPALIYFPDASGALGWPDHTVKEGDKALFYFIEYQTRPDTQVPILVFRIKRPSPAANTSNQDTNAPAGNDQGSWVRLEISAGCLARSPTSVGVKYSIDAEEIQKDLPNMQVLQDLAKANALQRIDFELWSADNKPTTGAIAERMWYGLKSTGTGSSRTTELDMAQYKLHNGDHMTPFEMALAFLQNETKFSVYTEFKGGDEAIQRLPRCFDYIHSICYAAANAGFYWWYINAGGDTPLNNPEYPFVNAKGEWLLFPRWLIEKAEVKYLGDKPMSYTAEHVQDFIRPDDSNFPDATSAAWANRLAMAREMQGQAVALDRLCKKLAGKVKCLIKTFADGQYCAHLWFEGLPKGATSVVMPEIKTRCSVMIKKLGKGMELTGAVCEDVFEQDCHVAVHCLPTDPKAPLLDDGEQFFANVVFHEDNKSSNRCMNAILSLMAGHPDRTDGVFLPNIALGAPVPVDQNTSYLSSPEAGGLTEDQRKQVLGVLEKLGCNEKQTEAAEQFLDSKDGLSLIWGPPGTGKTFGAMALVLAIALTGTPVLITAASNKAVQAAADSFRKSLDNLSDEFVAVFGRLTSLQYCRFTGAQFDVDYHSKEARVQGGYLTADELADQLAEGFQLGSGEDEDEEDAGVDVNMDQQAGSKSWADMTEEDQEKELAEHKARMLTAVLRTSYSNLQNQVDDESFSSKKLQYVNKFTSDPGLQKSDDEHEKYQNALVPFAALWYLNEAEQPGKSVKKEQLNELFDTFYRLDEYWTKEFLNDVLVVFSTNNSSCHPALSRDFHPMVLLVDEAAFATPADSMVPMAAHKGDLKHAILSGDHKQLKAIAGSKGLNEQFKDVQVSMFQQLIEDRVTPRDRVMYNVQYRQAPELSAFFKDRVYDNFTDHPSVLTTNDTRERFKAMMKRVPFYNGRLRVAINNEGHSGIFKGTASACNTSEADFCMNLAAHLIGHQIDPKHIQIVTPYSGQLRLLRAYGRSATNPALRDVAMATTNEMLGHENKIVILSMVQHQPDDDLAIGFIYLRSMITVATSRARDGLIIVGNFFGWLTEIMSAGESDFIRRDETYLFRELVLDLKNKNDIIAEQDFRDSFDGKTVKRNSFYDNLHPKAPQVSARGHLSGSTGRGRARGGNAAAGANSQRGNQSRGRGGNSHGVNRGGTNPGHSQAGRGGSSQAGPSFDQAQQGMGHQHKRRKLEDEPPAQPQTEPMAPQPLGNFMAPPRGRGGGRGRGRGARGNN